jgi:hypothetical protein
MSLFDRYDLAAQGTIEALYGEQVSHVPMVRNVDVNAPWVPDGSRSVQIVTAIYREKDKDPNVADQPDRMADRKPGISAHTHVIEVDPRRVAIDPRTGDQFIRVKDGSRWRVTSTDPDTMGRVHCNVSRIA